jgi:hypothetical protein
MRFESVAIVHCWAKVTPCCADTGKDAFGRAIAKQESASANIEVRSLIGVGLGDMLMRK